MSMIFSSGYGLVIGAGGDLPGTIDDANGLANILTDPTRCAYPTSQVQVLTGDGAKRNQILNALDNLEYHTRKDNDALALIFFSGHGLELPDYYLMPNGYDVKDLNQTAISGKEFTEKIGRIAAKKIIIILDCCHAGGMTDFKGGHFTNSPLPTELVDALKNGKGKVLLASSRKDEVSFTGSPYSAFTAALFEGLAGYGSSEQDGYARVLDIAIWTGRKVPDRTNDKQHPIIKVSNLENNFPLAYYSSGEKQIRLFDWSTKAHLINSFQSNKPQETTLRKMLSNYYENLALVEERMSEYVEYVEIPLQLVKSKSHIESQIRKIEDQINSLNS